MKNTEATEMIWKQKCAINNQRYESELLKLVAFPLNCYQNGWIPLRIRSSDEGYSFSKKSGNTIYNTRQLKSKNSQEMGHSHQEKGMRLDISYQEW